MGIESHPLSTAARSVWAKYGRTGDSADSWLPLHVHISDTAAVARHLWKDWLPQSTRALVVDAVGGDPDAGLALVAWLAGAHDLGKASPAFAMQVDPLAQRMVEAGLSMLRDRSVRIPHSLISHIQLKEWLVETQGWSPAVACSYAVVVGGHHGLPPTSEDLSDARKRPRLLGEGDAWQGVHRELADYAASLGGITPFLTRLSERPLAVPIQTLLTAIVILADWLASNEEFFSYWGTAEHSGSERADDAWKRLELPAPWRALEPEGTADEQLRARFRLPEGVRTSEAVRARPVQRSAIELAGQLEEPALLIVEAPMGEGKTELALLAAETFAARSGAGGVVFALPTMATSNAIFARLRRWVDALPSPTGSGSSKSLLLAHAKAVQNEEFRALTREARRISGLGDRSEQDSHETATAHQWLMGRKKGMLANFVVGTIDQCLFAALKSRHVVLRHLALANKVVIIDEVHASDAYMSVYLRRLLNWLGAYRVPTILMSATLDPEARRRLAAAYAGQAARRSGPESDQPLAPLLAETAYPLITAVTSGGRLVHARPEGSGRSAELVVDRLEDDDDLLVGTLQRLLAAGGSAAVIRNTVGRAQNTARFLRSALPQARIVLVHSRFLAVDREQKERELLDLLGPGSRLDEPVRFGDRPLIVVGTQVLEQSLDIDVDLMISDLAPIDLLLQRAGRLHRHDRPNRAESVRRPRLFITGVGWAADPPEPVPDSCAIYQYRPLLAAMHVLRPALERGEPIRFPEDIASLVRTAYASDLDVAEEWREAWARAQCDWQAFVADKEQRAKTFLLRSPAGRRSTLVDALAAAALDEGGEDGVNGQAQVRDTEDSVEVLVVQRIGGEIRTLPRTESEEGEIVPTEWRPPDRIAYVVAGCSVRLPHGLSSPRKIGRTIGALERNAFPGWQQSPVLRGQLALVLDESLRAWIGDTQVRYDRDDGLLVGEDR